MLPINIKHFLYDLKRKKKKLSIQRSSPLDECSGIAAYQFLSFHFQDNKASIHPSR